MRVSRLRTRFLALAVVTVTTVSGGVLGSGPAAAATALPAHVYSPYFETWTTDSITTIAQQSGARYFTLAFLETLSKSSCTLAWNGASADIVANGRYLSDIASLRAMGGDVVPSFGGWSADQGGTEIGDSCKNVNSIFEAYKGVVLKYDVSRLDMDIEGRSLTKTDGIDRRNKAIKLLQDWATSVGRPLTISYTLVTSPSGLTANSLAVLQNAKANNVRIDLVTPMVFDYYDRVTTDMGAAAISAANGLFSQLRGLLPTDTDAQLWSKIGLIIMNGIDDYPRRTEVTTLAHAQQIYDFAVQKNMSVLSMWAIQRDNGGCPGNPGENDCSGIVQNTWDFTNIFKPFTRA
jgi:hypothetical protein